jgi:hypothetical protein
VQTIRAKDDSLKRDDRTTGTQARSNDEAALFALTSAALAIILSNPTQGFLPQNRIRSRA